MKKVIISYIDKNKMNDNYENITGITDSPKFLKIRKKDRTIKIANSLIARIEEIN